MICFDVGFLICYTPPCILKPSKPNRDYLLRGSPLDMADKLKVAASLHRTSMREYMLEVLEDHLKELERKRVVLTLRKAT